MSQTSGKTRMLIFGQFQETGLKTHLKKEKNDTFTCFCFSFSPVILILYTQSADQIVLKKRS